MSFKCSLLGHEYDAEDTRTATEANGDRDVEVVQTVRQCARCDHETVVSENKQVRAKSDGGGDETPSTTEVAADGGGEFGAVDKYEDATEDDAIIIDDSSTEADPKPVEDAADEGDATDDDAVEGGGDDASPIAGGDEGVVFLGDDEGGETGGDDTDSSGEASSGDGAKVMTPEDESDTDQSLGVSGKTGVGAAQVRDEMGDAVFIDSGTDAESEADADQTPADADEASSSGGAEIITDSTPASEPEAATEDDAPAEEARPHEREDTRLNVDMNASTDADERMLACPECGYRESQQNECRWAGDSCPECRTAFLEWEEGS